MFTDLKSKSVSRARKTQKIPINQKALDECLKKHGISLYTILLQANAFYKTLRSGMNDYKSNKPEISRVKARYLLKGLQLNGVELAELKTIVSDEAVLGRLK